MNFRKLLNKETSFIVVSRGGATPLELDKVKWSKKLKDYWPKKNYKKTEGCIALKKNDLLKIIKKLKKNTVVKIVGQK